MDRRIFITGATGFLGQYFVKALAEAHAGELFLLIRPHHGQTIAERLTEFGLNLPRVTAIAGDITDPAVTAVAAQINHVDEFWHIAGLTDFYESKRAQLERVNVEGVRNALALAEVTRACHFYHISTAYVAGICDGPIPEDGLLPHPVFRNPYEETKYKGEKLVRSSVLPWTVIRPSILMGDSVTGEAFSDKMVYGVCKVYNHVSDWLKRELAGGSERTDEYAYYVLGHDHADKNCICIDDAVRLMLAVRNHGEIGRTYHCCHPQPVSVLDLHREVTRAADAPFIHLSPQQVPDADRKQRFLDKGCDVYAPYMLLSDPPFDLRNSRAVAPDFSPTPVTPTLLRKLFNVYTTNLMNKKYVTEDTSLDLSRLPDVKKHGSFTLAYETMSRQFTAFSVPETRGYLAYAIVGETAIMVGDPVSDQPATLLKAFLNSCELRNLRFCALQVGLKTAEYLRKNGCYINKLGIETTLNLNEFDFSLPGKQYDVLRHTVNAARRHQVIVREQPVSERCRTELSSVFADWLCHKKNTNELHLLLRPAALTPEPGVRHFLAEYQGQLAAVTFFTPIYDNSEVVGYYADIERYRCDLTGLCASINWMQLIAFEAAKVFVREGVSRIELGMSPLYRLAESPYNDSLALRDMLSQLYDESMLYAFKGISEHKKRYPCRVERPVFIATLTQTAAEEILDILKGVGFVA